MNYQLNTLEVYLRLYYNHTLMVLVRKDPLFMENKSKNNRHNLGTSIKNSVEGNCGKQFFRKNGK